MGHKDAGFANLITGDYYRRKDVQWQKEEQRRQMQEWLADWNKQ